MRFPKLKLKSRRSLQEIQREHRQDLVKALRSGEYAQTSNHLRDVNGFCCLGVASDIYRRRTGQGEWVPNGLHKGQYTFQIVDEKGNGDEDLTKKQDYVLIPPVQEYFGFRMTNGQMLNGSLSTMNDRGAFFTDIADVIEEEPDGLIKD